MNPEAHKLVQELESLKATSGLHGVLYPTHQTAVMGKLLVLIAEDMDRQTGRLIRLTWALLIVSAALLAFALVQTNIMFKQNADAHPHQIQAGQHQ